MVIVRTFGTVGMFGTPVAFSKLKIGSMFSTLDIIPSDSWNIFLHFGTLNVWYTGWYTTPIGTLRGFLVY